MNNRNKRISEQLKEAARYIGLGATMAQAAAWVRIRRYMQGGRR
ncbi:hypothetical protein [Nitratifractor sp.]